MPKLNFEVPHPLSVEDAKSKLQRFVEALQSRFQGQISELEQTWEGNDLVFGFKTFGIKIAGTIGVQEGKLLVDVELPFSAMMFKGKIESEIRGQLEKQMA
ncbi:MAG: polyhydroxyalkanoic acid system family protein [Planctomycetales bacterium]|nr:polyhydroxyalkanoic acid system family protein [Planctomycetales bacterium]